MAPLPPFETMEVALTMVPLFATAAGTFPNDANGRGNILWTEECFTRQFRAELSGFTHCMKYVLQEFSYFYYEKTEEKEEESGVLFVAAAAAS